MNINKKAQILIVDDYPTNIKVLSDLLIEYGFEVLIARDGENALQKLQRISPDIILLDVLMPGIDGFETCRRIKEQETTQDIPIIFMTALADPVDKIKGLTMGAVDYITKPFQQDEVLARVNTHLKLRRLTKQLEEQNARLQEEARSRQLAELALRSSEEKFAKAFRSNPGPMMILSLPEGRFLEVNQNFCKILDYPPEEVLGKTLNDLNLCCGQEDCDRFLALIQERGMVHNYECPFYSRSGDIRTLLISAEVIRVGVFPCILAMMLDITSCKQAAEELRLAKASADVANQAKSQFLATISHELRTPLNTILGYTQLISRDATLSVDQQEHLSIISQSSEHLLVLINDVLEMSKIESGHITIYEVDFNLSSLLDALYEMLKPRVEGKDLKLIVEQAPDVPKYIRTDATKLRQVLLNILSNGIKFTESGKVTLSVKTKEPQNSNLKIQTSTQQDQSRDDVELKLQTLVFEVADTGLGIAPDEIEMLFDPFVQTDTGQRSQEGTGLGLPISQRFIQIMGGTITVQSTVNVGSVFTVELPVALANPPEHKSTPAKNRVVGLAPGQPDYRILVVDDQTANRQVLAKLLRLIGFDVKEAVNGEEAIALYQQWEPHLIWMDIRMPVMDGYEATQKIKQLQLQRAQELHDHLESHQLQQQGLTRLRSNTKVIALTANSFEEEQWTALAAGYDDFVRKPIHEDVLFAKIAEHLGVRYVYQDIATPNSQSNMGSQPGDVDANTINHAPFTIDDDVRASLWDIVGDSKDFLASYIADNLEEFPKLMQGLKTAIRRQDAPTLSLKAHSLKGMGMAFKADRFVELCQIIELKADAGIVAIAPDQLQRLEAEFDQLMAALTREQQRLSES
jgi:PAS domain S-box-containing protein